MSRILSFSGNNSTLTSEYFPPIELPTSYECGLVSLYCYNSVPNVDKNNNLFHVGDQIIELPEGSYEINDIIEYITSVLKERNSKIIVLIKANCNTLHVEVKSSHPVYFNKNRTIGALLGFSKRVIEANKTVFSDMNVNINKINSFRVECNIITGSYMNDKPVHTIHEFSPDVLPGYKINEVPKNVIYLPVNVRTITSVIIKLVDQDGTDINFRNETITITLHLRPSG